jgi:hypothetical protein
MNTEAFGSKCETITDPDTGISIRVIWRRGNHPGQWVVAATDSRATLIEKAGIVLIVGQAAQA